VADGRGIESPLKGAVSLAVRVLSLLAGVLLLSTWSSGLWGAGEKAGRGEGLILEREMTVARFGEANGIGLDDLKKVFPLPSPSDLEDGRHSPP